MAENKNIWAQLNSVFGYFPSDNTKLTVKQRNISWQKHWQTRTWRKLTFPHYHRQDRGDLETQNRKSIAACERPCSRAPKPIVKPAGTRAVMTALIVTLAGWNVALGSGIALRF
jgi:hypothetical protein